MASTLSESWNRIERWFALHVPAALPSGASSDDIAKAEEIIGARFPKDMRESYGRHDGSNRLWLCERGYLMPLFRPRKLPRRKQVLFNEVVESWQFMAGMLDRGMFAEFTSRPQGEIRAEWWNLHWIPITSNDSGDHICVDVAPAKGGKKDQIIDWWHERGPTKVGTLVNGLARLPRSMKQESSHSTRSRRM